MNKRAAEARLSDVLAQAHAGTLPGMIRTGVTFSAAASEWLRYCVEDRACKPSTVVDYRHTLSRPRSHLQPAVVGGHDRAGI